MRADDCVDCHVLVIGSGGAGVRAAIESSEYGDVVLVSKTIVGKGGCTPMAEGGYNAVLREQDSCGIHFEDTMKGGAYLNDPELVRILVAESPQRMDDLIRWGAVFDFTENNEVAQRPFGGQQFPRTCYAGDRTGHEMMTTLVERLDGLPVNTLAEMTIIDLLKDGDRVIGALALDDTGELLVIKADSTILATGGGTRVFDISTNSASGTGDGFAIGFRAGAELIDMARAIATEILNGRGTANGGVYLDVTHLPREQIETQLPVMLEQFKKFGVDIRNEPMEVAPTAHHIMGGLRITSRCETTLPGLFACGEVAGGVHGANRLGGNALADTQVFGKRAGESAGRSKKRVKKIDALQIDAQQKRLMKFFDGTMSPASVAKELQLAMWKGAGIFRNATGLRAALATCIRLSSSDLKAVSARSLAECCTVQNMCLTASLICKSALLREESRGAHVRTDISQSHEAKTSPFSHTYISPVREGIEQGISA
jgi:fumarate reductase (CoM/CoB) subunit A